MRQNKTKQLYNYWMDLFWAAGNTAGSSLPPIWPQRGDVHPAACRSLLGDMFILEIGESDLTYRLAGTRLCALYGHELKGNSFDSTFGAEDREAAKSWAARAGIENYIAVMSGTATDTAGNRISLESLLLPVACNSRLANRILGLTVACNSPVTIGNRAVDNQCIRSVRTLRPWEEMESQYATPDLPPKTFGTPTSLRSVVSEHETPSLSSPNQHLYANSEENSRQVAHLRVYEGGKSIK